MSWPRELDVVVGKRRIRVRDAGDPEGTPVVLADQLHVERFAVLGQSAGSRFALAAAAALRDWVICAGCASSSGPVQEVPGAMDELDRTDEAAYELLPDHSAAAATRLPLPTPPG